MAKRTHDDTSRSGTYSGIAATLRKQYELREVALSAVIELKTQADQRAFIISYADHFAKENSKWSEKKRYAMVETVIKHYLEEAFGRGNSIKAEDLSQVNSWITSLKRFCKPEREQEPFPLIR